MFEQFSDSARGVILFTRLVAGRRGGAALECEHLLEGILMEDSPRRLPTPFDNAQMSFKPHRPFFADAIADALISELDSAAVGTPIEDSVDMEISTGLGNTLSEAVTLAQRSPRKIVEPLHLLLALIQTDESAANRLRMRGVTSEAVAAALESGEYF